MAAVLVDNLIKRYGGRQVLRVPNLVIRRGETIALYGPNGAGKSTLLKILALIEPFDEGRLRLFNSEAESARTRLALRRRTAMVFDEPVIYKGRVYDNVAVGLKLRRVSKPELDNRVNEVLELLRISHLKERAAKELSRGEAQRLCLARALAVRPELLLLDEPLNGLDAESRKSMTAELQKLLNNGLTSVYVTHDADEARYFADRVVYIDRGELKKG